MYTRGLRDLENQYSLSLYIVTLGTAVAQWLRCCATNRKVAGSIPAGVIWIFHSHRTMALVSTQPLTEISTRRISWGNGGRCVRLTTLQLCCAVVMKSGNLNFLEPSGPIQACNWFLHGMFTSALNGTACSLLLLPLHPVQHIKLQLLRRNLYSVPYKIIWYLYSLMMILQGSKVVGIFKF